MNNNQSHEFYMNMAIHNAKVMSGQTSPNPLVGAVIVRDGEIVGFGAHMKAGEPHAEIHALRMAGDKAKGATIYVTLEPCSHYGRTGPCAVALIEAGITNVVVATLDPNPIVAGNGVRILEDAGIKVITGVMEAEAKRMNEVFNHFIVTGRPFITLKTASSLDGKIATHTHNSKWITSEGAREDVHKMRNVYDAILVGANTILEDNPSLTTRLENNHGKNPIRIIIDSALKIPLHSKVLTDKEAPTWIFTSKMVEETRVQSVERLGASVIKTSGTHQVNLHDVVNYLGKMNVSSLIIEGGGTINSSFVEEKLVQKAVIYFAPKLIGGKEAPTFLEGKGVAIVSQAIDLENMTITSLGKDFKIEGYPIYKEEGTHENRV
ncbi:5-amino-6-(5-phosphoribosylamino)uracil reductase [Bacillus coahuilensis m2-6]|uniref:Riboflavin biosynthesis protein RibD n=1 Tax=Bacillus coahuilensis p1.1.43 TaxID=1150625 RepID=A0A147K941_9BACI|nr:bifunctional diaminohydroxyphosphoribosylaminopyrimidine deaminase/5-amino-6-(5-phosphoribosylamino)uracil reductase RibD [Bacillus coahuilensis]KUP06850.1 5-amino-6-(5-phosphoribosylamino)uracil reductase [Bacillus coahuilensis p1.1.43]KUP08403.1 5-amino-6-(5-phosphoribosylamino)uracil reductase [Bacillus coahuilensis m2-6]